MVLTASVNTAKCSNCELEFSAEALFCPQCGTAKSRDLDGDPLLGSKIGDRFLLTERIGHGASGTIYRGEHVTLRRKVAIKVLHHELSRDDLAIERFRREATTVSEIENEHIVQIHDFGRTDDGRLYLAMELLEGETLDNVLEREGQVSIGQVVDVLIQLGEALAEAHEAGFVHRDLRPRNIYLAKRRKRANFVKLLDFGLAKLVVGEDGAASTSLGMTFGEPKYMSPEQARGDTVDMRADIYSLGCIAYEMLTGQPPFVGGRVFDILTRHVDEVPDPPRARRPQIPEWLDAIVVCMLAKSPGDRFSSVNELVEALRAGSETGQVIARRPSAPVRTPRQSSAPVGAVTRPPEYTPPAGQLTPAANEAVQRAARISSAPVPAQQPVAQQPVAQQPVAQQPVAQQPVAQRPVAQQPVAQRPVEPPPKHLPAEPVAAAEPTQADADDPDDYRATTEVDAARVKSHLAAQGKQARPPSAGISAAWYADGEALGGDEELDDSMLRKLERARGTGRIAGGFGSTSDMYFDERPRRWPYFAVAGGVLLVVLAIALWPGGSKRKQAANEPAAAPVVDAGVSQKAPVADAAPVPDAAVDKAKTDVEPKRVKHSHKPNRVVDHGPLVAKNSGGKHGHHGKDGNNTANHKNNNVKPPANDKKRQMAVFWAKRGKLALNNSDVVGAATAFKKARELDPNNVDAIMGQGELALGQSAYGAAIKHLRRAVRMRPNNYYVHTLLGEAYLGAGNKSRARGSFQRALKINPDYARAREGYNDASK